MRTTQRIFFDIPRTQGQEAKQVTDPDYLFNTMVFELFNNWEHVTDLWKRFKGGGLKEVDPLEKDWLNFAISNKISIDKYEEDSEKFIEENFKNKTI